MEQEKKSAFGTALKYAVITSLVLFIFSIITYMTNLYLNQSVSWITYAILLTGLVLAVKHYRDKDLGGYMSFGDGFMAGFLFSIIAGVLGVMFNYIMVTFIAPDMIAEILKKAETDMINKGLPDDQIAIAMKYTRQFTTPLWMAIWIFGGSLIFGTILSLIVAAIFKKQSDQLQQPQ